MPVLEAGPRPVNRVNTTLESENYIIQGGNNAVEPPTVYMANGIVYKWGTQDRLIHTTADMGMFDNNQGIRERRKATLAGGTIIVEGRTVYRKGV